MTKPDLVLKRKKIAKSNCHKMHIWAPRASSTKSTKLVSPRIEMPDSNQEKYHYYISPRSFRGTFS